MNHLKDYLKTRVEYMLTYADENAKGFFKKQGFSETILIDRKMWRGYIKDYDSATLRCCRLFPQVNYSNIRKLVSNQWESVYRAAAARSHHRSVYTLPPEPLTNVAAIPGLAEAGWDEASLQEQVKPANDLQERLNKLLSEVWDHSDSWPFRQPVLVEEVKDYLTFVKTPMGSGGRRG